MEDIMVNSLNCTAESKVLLLNVKKEDPIIVAPAKETPNDPYFLSILDQCVVGHNQASVRTLFSFKSEGKGNENVFHVLKEALSRVLVEYYPFAGRLKVGEDGKLFVECNGEGAVMVEALADFGMEELGDLTDPNEEITNKLIYVVPGAKCIMDVPPLAAQVTKFKCGGFTLGLTMNHCWADGIAGLQFVNSWSETARGVPLSAPPFLDRKLLMTRTPPKPKHELQEFIDIKNISGVYDTEELHHQSFILSHEKLEKLKALAMEDSSIIKCTTFEVCTAFIWRARTKALRFVPDQQVRLSVPVDIRSRFNLPLPKGYFGNAVLFTNAICKACELVEKPLAFAVILVQQAIKNATDGYLRSALYHRELMFGKPWPPLVASMITNSWARLPFKMTDFGWGETLHWGPTAWPDKNMVLFLANGKELAGMKVLISLPSLAMSAFEEAIEI